MKNIYERYIGQWKKSESSRANRVFGLFMANLYTKGARILTESKPSEAGSVRKRKKNTIGQCGAACVAT